MGAPLGNTNRADNKRFKLALQAALDKRSTEKVNALEQLADILVTEGLGRNIAAIRDVRDTLDGKPAQAVNLGDHEGNALTIKLVQFNESK